MNIPYLANPVRISPLSTILLKPAFRTVTKDFVVKRVTQLLRTAIAWFSFHPFEASMNIPY
jgi:hypothetical protein